MIFDQKKKAYKQKNERRRVISPFYSLLEAFGGRENAFILTVRSFPEGHKSMARKGATFGYSNDVLKFKGLNHYTFSKNAQQH